MTKQEMYNELINKYGEKQVVVAIEELSELSKELCKALRFKASKKAIIEEMADVYIMLDQMKLYFGIDKNDVVDAVIEKNKRTYQRLKDEKL